MTDSSSPKYYREEPVLGKQVKELFRRYVGIQEDDEIVRHIKDIVCLPAQNAYRGLLGAIALTR